MTDFSLASPIQQALAWRLERALKRRRGAGSTKKLEVGSTDRQRCTARPGEAYGRAYGLKAGYTEKTDIWSFGVMAYALLFNEFPYGPRVRDKDSAWSQSSGFSRQERIRGLILQNAEPHFIQA